MRFPWVVMLFLLAACGDTTAPVPSHEWSFEETGDPLIGAQIRVIVNPVAGHIHRTVY